MNLPLEDEEQQLSRGKRILHFTLVSSITLFIVAVIYGLFSLFHFDRFIEDLERRTFDIRAIMMTDSPKHSPSDEIAIVVFDDNTLNHFNDEYGTWPWPRDIHADMIQFMNKAGTRMIAYDIMFVSSKKGFEESDRKFIEAFQQYDNVYLSMNFDHNLEVSKQLNKALTPEEVNRIMPLAIDLESQLNPSSTSFPLDSSHFFQNPQMTFDNFRPILPPLMEEGERIAFINHSRDQDGVSRGNPLFFRYKHYVPALTEHQPLTQDKKTGQWHDSQGNPVTQDGQLLDTTGTPQFKLTYKYFPYMGLRLLLDLKYPDQNLKFTLTEKGELQFADRVIPLSDNGNFQIAWHNVNVERVEKEKTLKKLEAYKSKLLADPELSSPNKQEDLRKVTYLIHEYERDLQRSFSPKPYQEIPAWLIIRSIHNEAKGILTEEDKHLKELLKDKIIFVGATALSTYDIKNTSIDPMMAGVILQANLFDNLLNERYVRRVSPNINLLAAAILCLLSCLMATKMRSALAGFLSAALLAVTYIIIAIILYKDMYLWLNIAMPLVCLMLTITLTFMVKYISRDKDYKETYQLANTDSMTGLYNHRFFQEHMKLSIERAEQTKTKFSLILIDIDFFKKFNDTYGHQAGDEVLRAVARKLKGTVRGSDVVARYGGEEMAVILDRANEEEALTVANKLVKAVAEEAYPIAEGVAKHVTISAGVSTYPTHGLHPNELIEFSDQGLYRAKENGRNQVGAQYDTPQEPDQAASA